jgi:hypothetical protein
MHPPRALTACVLVLAALALSACGGDDSSTAAETRERTSAADRADEAPPPSDANASDSGGCAAQTRELLTRLDTLRERLVTGLDYRDYVAQMKRVRGSYEALPVNRLGIACLNDVGGPAESAVNDYIDALNVWAGCVEVPGCQSTSIEGRLQTEWQRAARALGEARRAVRG